MCLAQYRSIRERLDAELDLLNELIEYRQLMQWGVVDTDDARRELDRFQAAIEGFKRARDERGRRP